MLQCFPPISNPDITILILGSMPGNDSLKAGKYYAHPRNTFWPIMAELFKFQHTLSYGERLALLTSNGIGLWDVIGRCKRKSSLDSTIVESSIQVNDFSSFLKNHPRVTRIFFNGGKAEQSFRRYVVPTISTDAIALQRLPSTSPAHARMSYQEKRQVWREALLSTPHGNGENMLAGNTTD